MLLNDGTPGRTQTFDLLIRSQTLYSTELRVHVLRDDLNSLGRGWFGSLVFLNIAANISHQVIDLLWSELVGECRHPVSAFADLLGELLVRMLQAVPFKQAWNLQWLSFNLHHSAGPIILVTRRANL